MKSAGKSMELGKIRVIQPTNRRANTTRSLLYANLNFDSCL